MQEVRSSTLLCSTISHFKLSVRNVDRSLNADLEENTRFVHRVILLREVAVYLSAVYHGERRVDFIQQISPSHKTRELVL